MAAAQPVVLLELMVPWKDQIGKANEWKRAKYRALAEMPNVNRSKSGAEVMWVIQRVLRLLAKARVSDIFKSLTMTFGNF